MIGSYDGFFFFLFFFSNGQVFLLIVDRTGGGGDNSVYGNFAFVLERISSYLVALLVPSSKCVAGVRVCARARARGILLGKLGG